MFGVSQGRKDFGGSVAWSDASRRRGPERVTMPQTDSRRNLNAERRARHLETANRSIMGELSLPELLRRAVAAARDVTGADYAAIAGIAGIAGDGVLPPVHTGMPSEMVAAIAERQQLRRGSCVADDDPRSVPFGAAASGKQSSNQPPNDRPRAAVSRVPVHFEHKVYANLYLVNAGVSRRFTAEDKQLVTALAATTGIAIENARLYEESRMSREWLRAAGEITRQLLSFEGDQAAVLQNIVESMKKLARVSHDVQFTEATLDMAGAFAIQATIVLGLAASREDQQRLVVLEEQDRIARDLHDHVIQRLFAAEMSLESMSGLVVNPDVRARLAGTVDDLDDTIRQIRSSIFALQGSRRDPTSVRTTVLKVLDQVSPLLGFRPRTRLDGPLDTLVDPDVVADVEAVLRESLTNVARHAHADVVLVEVGVDSTQLSVVIADNGIGLANPERNSGLHNLEERAQQRGGSLTLSNQPKGGLQVAWSIPLTP